MTLIVKTDRKLIRAEARSTRYLLARITAPRSPERGTRVPVNVAFVLDRSGSMEGDRKFTLAREAVEQALRMLRPEDRFALVVYDTEVDVLARSRYATPDAKRRALEELRTVGPRGGTDLGAGWLRGCEQVAEFIDSESISRCLLLTDGLANHGIVDREALASHAGELRRRGVATSTFGVGADFDERLLRDMAHEGGGNFYFIEGASQIPGILTGELGEALEITMRGAELTIQLPAGVEAETLNRFRQRVDDVVVGARRDSHVDPRVPNVILSGAKDLLSLRIELGDLTSNQELDVIIKFIFPRGDVGSEIAIKALLGCAESREPRAESESQVWTFASHADNDAQERDREVDRAVAEIYAARARAEATEANRDGDFGRAQRVIARTAGRIRTYAGRDRQLQNIARSLEDDVTLYSETQMSPMAIKAHFYVAESSTRGRDSFGRARKST